MKRLLSFFCIAPLTMFAQLKVDSNGKILVNEATNMSQYYTPNSMVTIGDDPNYIWGDFSIIKMGVECCQTPSTYNETIGIFSEVYPSVHSQATQPFSTAIMGVACGSSTANFGVVGSLNGNSGAAVYGSTVGYGHSNTFTGTYAGYFDGATYVNGNLTTSHIYNHSDMRLRENVTLLSESVGTKGNVVDNLKNLNVIEYNFKRAVQDEPKNNKAKQFIADTKQDSVEINRRHYGLSAQELQTVFPDLVLKGQDGYLAINYTELVPILIRSIQELKQELDEVRGEANTVAKSRGLSTVVNEISASAGNVLYQNTPNPFKEQTVIRFSLADDARDAAICIFDMTGKMLKKMPISSGETSVSINGWELGEGMFLYTLIVNGREIDTKRMIITK